MTQLEKVYLANVLLYFDSIEDVIKFIQMNKKCQDVPKMLKLLTMLSRTTNTTPPYFFLHEHNCISEVKEIFNISFSNKFMKLFPNVETIELYSEELYVLKHTNKIKQIRLKALPEDISILNNYINVITEINCFLRESMKTLNFSIFTNLKKCYISWGYSVSTPIETLFPNQKQHLQILFLYIYNNFNVLKGIEKYNNFNKIIIQLESPNQSLSEDEQQRINQLKLFTTIITRNITLQNIQNYYIKDNIFKYRLSEDSYTSELLEQLQKQYYFDRMNLERTYHYEDKQNIFDFSKQTQLTSLKIHTKDSIVQLPNEPNYLIDLNLSNSKVLNAFPISLTSLSISGILNINTQLNLPNLLELEVSKPNDLFFLSLTTLTSLTCCQMKFTKSISCLTNIQCLELVGCSKEKIQPFYPSSLKHLRFEECKNWDLTDIYDISLISLHLFNKTYSYRFFSSTDDSTYSDENDNNNYSLQEVPLNFDQLPSLNVLHLKKFDFTGSHSFITQLIIIDNNYINPMDLTTYCSLKEIGFKKCYNCFIQLPKCVESVYLHKSNILFDVKDLQLKALHFLDCESIDYESFKTTSITKLFISPLTERIDEIFQMFPSVASSNYN
ncbi:Leucine-rich repeat containing protein [Entamoeba marina]